MSALDPADLLRRALKNHDAIAAALRSRTNGPRLHKAIDDMNAVKDAARVLGCYPLSSDMLRGDEPDMPSLSEAVNRALRICSQSRRCYADVHDIGCPMRPAQIDGSGTAS